MSDSDSDDFFYNQDLSEEEDELEIADDTNVVNTSTLKLSTPLIANKKRAYNDENLKNSSVKTQKTEAETENAIDKIDSQDDSDSIVLLSDESPSSDSYVSEQEILPAKSAREKKPITINTHDETFDFLNEITKDAKRFDALRKNDPRTRRIYNINFVSTLEGTQNKRVNVKVTGNKSFESILPITIKSFIKSYKVPRSLQMFYKPADLVLFRAGIEVLPFSNCDSLQIPSNSIREEAEVDLIIVHASEAQNYKNEYKRIRDSRLHSFDDENESKDENPDSKNDDKFKLFEKELENAPKLEMSPDEVIEIAEMDSEEENIIRLVLIDKKNKRTSIPVHPSMTFSDIAEKYKQISKLSSDTVVKLTFENTDMEPSETVESQDLEEDDILEIKII